RPGHCRRACLGHHRPGRNGGCGAHGRARRPAASGRSGMNRPLLIENARVVDPASGTDARGAVLVENGMISDVALSGPVGVPEGADVIDARGLVLAPGLIDMRVFTGEPGKEYRETLQSAGEAAAAGGVTSFVMMPDTTPVVDDGALVDFLVRRAQATSKVHVLPA